MDVVGYCFLNLGSKHQPQDEFVRWIQKGSKPIYIGFGSMVCDLMYEVIQVVVCIPFLFFVLFINFLLLVSCQFFPSKVSQLEERLLYSKNI